MRVSLLITFFALSATLLVCARADLIGIEGRCVPDDIICTSLPLMLWHFDGVERKDICQVVVGRPPHDQLQLKRFHTYDSQRNYYFLAMLQGGGVPDVTLYTVDVMNKKLLYTYSVNDTVLQLDLFAGMQFDQQTGTLFGVFGSHLAALNYTNGGVTDLGAMWGDNYRLYPQVTSFDSATGRIFVSVNDESNDTKKIVTYNTRTRQFTLSNEILHEGLVKNEIQYMLWDGESLVGLADSFAYASIFEITSPEQSQWKFLMTSREQAMQTYDVLDRVKSYGDLIAWENREGHSGLLVNLIDKSDPMNPTTIITRFDLKRKFFYDTDTLSEDATNYVYISPATGDRIGRT